MLALCRLLFLFVLLCIPFFFFSFFWGGVAVSHAHRCGYFRTVYPVLGVCQVGQAMLWLVFLGLYVGYDVEKKSIHIVMSLIQLPSTHGCPKTQQEQPDAASD